MVVMTLLLGVVWPALASAVVTERTRQLLVLNSYHQTSVWTDQIMAGILPVLNDPGLPVEVHSEYLDAQRHPLAEIGGEVEALLAAKYRTTPLDLIIVSDDDALDFLLSRRQQLFPEVPIVFCGINDFHPRKLKDHTNITGVNQDIDVKENIDLARRLLPGLQRLVVVSDQTTTGRANSRKFQEAIRANSYPDLAFELFDDLTLPELIERIAALPKESAVLVLRIHQTSEGRELSPDEYLARIVTTSKRPVFKLWGPHFDDGVTGGVMVSGEAQGRLAAQLALRVLRGESADSIPVVLKSPNVTMLDSRQLEKMGIDTRLVPDDALLLYQTEPVFEKFRAELLVIGALLLLMAGLIVVLIFGIRYRRRAEQAASEALGRQRELVKWAGVGLWDWDLLGQRVDYSDEWKHQLGYGLAEIGEEVEEWRSRVHPEDLERLEHEVQRSIADPKIEFGSTFRMRHKDGSYRWILTQGSVMRDHDGRPVRMTGSHIDITDQRERDLALERSWLFLETLIQALPDLCWLKDPDGVYLFANHRFEQFFGERKETIVGKTDFDFVERDLAEFFRAHDERAIRERRPCRNEEEVTFADDGHREILDTIKCPIFAANGELVGVLGIGRDITERKRFEEALRESEERFRQAVENIPDGLVIYGTDLRVKHANRAMSRLLGVAFDESFGKRDSAFWPPSIYGDYLGQLEQAIAEGKAGSLEVRLPGEPERQLKLTCVPIIDATRQVKEVVAIANDLTEHYQAEEERLAYKTRMLQSQKMESIGTLAGGIAHDFNNILASVIGFSELALSEADQGSTIEDSLQEIHSAGLRARGLVRQILAFARKSDQDVQPVQLAEIVREVLKMLRSSLPTTIEIRQQLETEALVVANPTQLHQIMMNLGTNAGQAMESRGGVLTVTLRDVVLTEGGEPLAVELAAGDYVELTVSDTGTGIAPEHLANIFEPYFTTKVAGKGSGLGLAVVSGIVAELGGQVTVRSEVGSGTTFTLYLPVTREKPVTSPVVETVIPKGRERILFVDDESQLISLGKRSLGRLGYEVTGLTSSREALALFTADPAAFDLVVTDMTMPELTGTEMVGAMLAVRPDLPVILCTGYSSLVNEGSALELGVRALVYKPVVQSELAVMVRQVLDGKNLLESEET